MDLVVKKGELLRELQFVQGVVERKTTVPILSNLLLETSGNSLLITATDLDVTLQCGCVASVKVSGAQAVSARKLFDIVRLLPDSDIHVKSSSQDWLNVNCERSRFRIASLTKSSFPEVPSLSPETITLPAKPLRYMIDHSVFAVSQEDSRFALGGALMLLNRSELTLVTTDGHRLVLISKKENLSGVTTERRVLVPRKTLVELGKLIDEGILSLEFGSTDNHLYFQVGDRLLVSRVLTGQFPNYEMVIPRENNLRIAFSVEELTASIRRAAVMADEQSRGVRFSIQPGQIDIFSANANFGEAKESVPAEYDGDSFEIGFNFQYLLDFLTVLEGGRAQLELKDGDTQGLFKPVEQEEYRYEYVVMPMKI